MEISFWDEFADAFEGVDKYSGKSYIFKLTKDLYMEDKDIPVKQRYGVYATVYGCDITFDFNKHTLNCTATRYNIKDFIIIVLLCASSYETVNAKIDWRDRSGTGDKCEFKTDDSFMIRLQQIVSKYNFAKYNGYVSKVSGLPDMYGAKIDIAYASGENIYAHNNQDCFVPFEAVKELIELFEM